MVTKSIAFKPSIETSRFNRLCHAFRLSPNQVQREGGECDFLLGLKAHSLKLNREARFNSDVFPHVGVYSSPLLSKYIFVGVSDHVQAPTVALSTSASFRTQTIDETLYNWLKAYVRRASTASQNVSVAKPQILTAASANCKRMSTSEMRSN